MNNPLCFGVMGNPVAHSLSPFIHQSFAQQFSISLCYQKIEVPIASFEQEVIAFFDKGGMGLNITVPFKERAFKLATVKTSRCERAGAANTLWVKEGVLYADNTDGIGLIRDLEYHMSVAGKTILLLGAGGAARGILGPLLDAQPQQLILSNRTLEKAELLKSQFPKMSIHPWEQWREPCDLIINTTAGWNDLTRAESIMVDHPFCYDLVYNLSTATPFTYWAKRQGCKAIDGLGMLIEQAAESFLVWHGVMPNVSVVKTLLEKRREEDNALS